MQRNTHATEERFQHSTPLWNYARAEHQLPEPTPCKRKCSAAAPEAELDRPIALLTLSVFVAQSSDIPPPDPLRYSVSKPWPAAIQLPTTYSSPGITAAGETRVNGKLARETGRPKTSISWQATYGLTDLPYSQHTSLTLNRNRFSH